MNDYMKISDAMRPILLQARKDSKDNLSGRELTVSGWGFPKAEGGIEYHKVL